MLPQLAASMSHVIDATSSTGCALWLRVELAQIGAHCLLKRKRKDMKKSMYALIAMPMLVLPALALADESGGIVAHASGTTKLCVLGCPSPSSLGLVCDQGQGLIATDIKASFWRGICDNFNSPTCLYREVRVLDEQCVLVPTDLPGLQTSISKGIFEISVSGDLAGSGSSRAQTRTPTEDAMPGFTAGTVELRFEETELGIDAIVGEFTAALCSPPSGGVQTGFGDKCGIAVTFREYAE